MGNKKIHGFQNRLKLLLGVIICCGGATEPASAEGAVLWSPFEYPIIFWREILWMLPLAIVCKWFFVKEVMERSWSQSLLPLGITQISHLTIGMVVGFFVCALLVSGWFEILVIWLTHTGEMTQEGQNQYAWTFWVLYCVVMTATVALVELITLKVFYWRSLILSFKKFSLLWGGQAIFMAILIGMALYFEPSSILLRIHNV